MRILLDENLDWRLRRDLPEHQVESVPLFGWGGIQNGEGGSDPSRGLIG